MHIDTRLCAPETYWLLPKETLHAMVNGCGTSGWKGRLVPDSIWGLCITPVCDIHDYEYTIGLTVEDKDRADRTFHNNGLRLIADAARKSFWGRLLRRRREILMWAYYEAVSHCGGPAFWTGKNPEAQLKEVPHV